ACAVVLYSTTLRFFSLLLRRPHRPPLFPYTTLFRSIEEAARETALAEDALIFFGSSTSPGLLRHPDTPRIALSDWSISGRVVTRSEEHTSELQSLTNLVCRLLLEIKKKPRSLTTPLS